MTIQTSVIANRPADSEPAAYTIKQWCERWHISPPMYFKLQRAGGGPQTLRIGRRVLISIEADKAWRRKREVASQPSQECEAL